MSLFNFILVEVVCLICLLISWWAYKVIDVNPFRFNWRAMAFVMCVILIGIMFGFFVEIVIWMTTGEIGLLGGLQ